MAAYAILENTWYIVPEKAIRGMSAICLCSTMPKYEQYREAWQLLREASGCEELGEETVSEPVETAAGPAFVRMQAAMNSFRKLFGKGWTVKH